MLLQHPQYSDHYFNAKTLEICRVYTTKTGKRKIKVKKTVLNSNGYKAFKVYLGNNKYKFFTAHRFMAECLAGRRLGKNEHIDHIDQDPLNNHPSNLRIVSRSVNRLNSDKSKGYYVKHPANENQNPRYQVFFRSVYQGAFDTAEEAQAHYETLKQAALEVELNGVLTLQEMIEEVA